MEVKHFPSDIGSYEMDRTEMKKCLFSGLFEETAEVNGEKRIFYTYLTPGLLYNQQCLVVAPPDDVPVLEYLEKSPWITLADQKKIFLHVLVPGKGGWRTDGWDGDYMNKVYVEIQSRKYYVTMQDNIYGAGVGKGAVIAQQAAMKMTSEWSGLATFGDLDESALINAEISGAAGNAGATELSISGVKAQLPVWMAWGENSGSNAKVCDYWKAQNDAGEETYSSRAADEIYVPRTVCRKSQVNEEKIAQVRITNGFCGYPGKKLAGQVWDYISRARRHRCFGAKALRYFADPAEYGATRHTLELDGFTRIWYEYVPEKIKDSKVPVPLVTVMHGRGGSAETFMDLSGMNRVAEERGFIAIFPEAGVYQQRPGGLRNVLLWNGSYMDKRMDDNAFIMAAIEDVKSRYNIDPTRIYACGQSSGGMMTSSMALYAPKVFAAVSPWSAIRHPDFPEPLPESIDPAVPYLFLFGDKDWLCVDREHGELEYHVSRNIAAFLKNMMKLYHLEETPLEYICGEIHYYVYRNAKRVPLLTVGVVKDMTHANYPRESWIAYDEFMCKFSKGEGGRLYYMGEEV